MDSWHSWFLLSVYGITSIHQARTEIVDEARRRLEPVIADTEQHATAAKADVQRTEQNLSLIKAQLDETSKLADEQKKRIDSSGGEIGHKLEQVQKEADTANALGDHFERQANDFETELRAMKAQADGDFKRLQETQKGFQTQIAQISKQIDDVSVRQAYPTLGQKMFVTFNGKPWKPLSEKKATDKWVNIVLDPLAIGEARVSTEQLESLASALKRDDYSPFFGNFGFGGAVSSGYSNLSENTSSAVFYFDSRMQTKADMIAKQAGQILGIPNLQPIFVDTSKVDRSLRFVIENSGLDLQIFIARAPR